MSLATQLYAFGVMTRVAQIRQGGERMVVMLAALIPAVVALGVGLGAIQGPNMSRAELARQTREELARITVGLNAQEQAQLTERLQQQANGAGSATSPAPPAPGSPPRP